MPGKQSKLRLDQRMVSDGLAESRSAAARIIMAGKVKVDGLRVDKAGHQVSPTQIIAVETPPRFVSRGGDKLANAMEDLSPVFEDSADFCIEGRLAIDIGASTGGFTDCLLQCGAARVIAVDVGYGQLHPRIRGDKRVHVMDRTNARHLTPDDLPYKPDLLVCDASFISLEKVLPAVISCMSSDFFGLLLCKPQFEAGPERLGRFGKKGVITDEAVREEILNETIESLRKMGLESISHVEARPRGDKGNVEYVILVR